MMIEKLKFQKFQVWKEDNSVLFCTFAYWLILLKREKLTKTEIRIRKLMKSNQSTPDKLAAVPMGVGDAEGVEKSQYSL